MGDIFVARIIPWLENGKTAFVNFLKKGQVGWESTGELRAKDTLKVLGRNGLQDPTLGTGESSAERNNSNDRDVILGIA